MAFLNDLDRSSFSAVLSMEPASESGEIWHLAKSSRPAHHTSNAAILTLPMWVIQLSSPPLQGYRDMLRIEPQSPTVWGNSAWGIEEGISTGAACHLTDVVEDRERERPLTPIQD